MKRGCLITATLVGAASLFCVFYVRSCFHDPPDAEMILHFQQHRSEFTEVTTMMNTEKDVVRITHGFTQDYMFRDAPVPAERLKHYRDLMSALSIVSINRTESCVYLLTTNRGFAGSGSAKGYAFCSETPKKLVESLDVLRPPPPKFAHYFRSIEGNWYLLYIYAP